MGNISSVYGVECCGQSDDDQYPGSNQDPPSPALVDEENKYQKSSLELTKTAQPLPTLKDFKLVSLIGRGSFANVYLAYKIDSKEYYALKILSKELIRKKNQKYHTLTERILLEQLQHPFIVTLHYAFQSSTELYFAMEFMQGGNYYKNICKSILGELFFHLKQSNKFTEKKAKFYSAELILALEYLHANNVIYRDLKPENILLGADGHLKITDFGLSKMGIGINDKTYTFCGSPHYLAPEIILKKGHGKAVDWEFFYMKVQYLFILIFSVLCGEPPFYGPRNELFSQIIEKPVQMKSFFSSEAKDLLYKLLQSNPKKRLGYGPKDSEEIKAHSFFRGIDWNKFLKKIYVPPFKPKIGGEDDIRHFDFKFTSVDIKSTHAHTNSFLNFSHFSNDKYSNFDFINNKCKQCYHPKQHHHKDFNQRLQQNKSLDVNNDDENCLIENQQFGEEI